MSNKMLIDATHPEETRVVVLRGSRVEEFDFEAADRQLLRGNIYLAKVTRVEPSLQAAFVDYGGNRHGFLAFSEIHPDYYQIPFADRQALIQAQAEEDEEEEARHQAAEDRAAQRALAQQAAEPSADEVSEPAGDFVEAPLSAEAIEPHVQGDWPEDDEPGRPVESPADEPGPDAAHADGPEIGGDAAMAAPAAEEHADESHAADQVGDQGGEVHGEDAVESVGAEDALEEVPQRRKPRPRQYKIQEVIKRRQVLLVQVVKEERGNKGAALTTYLSLAGRYSVLMPNTGRGGGISRKITNPADRKRLKSIASELDVPEGMGVILRTAGANRTKAEVKRDFEYLLRLWENVRELTLRSSAPKLVYEEGSLIKRSIRDLYSKEIEQIVVAGDDAYREAKDFMRMLMPSHARNVQQYRDDSPIFARSGVEAQLDAMFSPQVTLKSGGYIVINQTEALVSIDVNSGRSTREHSIEDTALNTNLEAAEEIARQLRLRDLAGLIVIDFIDMEENRNNRSVERKMKDCLRHDRARIQVGRISHFGLMEMSRQRLRTGVLESSVVACPHCRGTGQVRSISSLSLQILRAIEDQLLRNAGHHLYIRTRPEVALYVLNQKRRTLAELEVRFGLTITVTGDAPENGVGFTVERGEPVEERPQPQERAPIAMIESPVDDETFEDEPQDEGEELDAEAGERGSEAREREGGEGREKRRRRRRRGRGNGEERSELPHGGGAETVEAATTGDEAADEPDAETRGSGGEGDEADQEARRRRRGRRGGRRRGRSRENGGPESGATDQEQSAGAEAEDFGSDSDFTPGDGSDDEARLLTPGESSGGGDEDSEPVAPDETFQPAAEAAFAPDSVLLPEAAALPQAAAEQVEGVLGSDRPTGDANADEMEALTDAVQRPDDRAAAEQPAPEPEMAPSTAAADPVDDNAPKRSGWWSRKTLFGA